MISRLSLFDIRKIRFMVGLFFNPIILSRKHMKFEMMDNDCLPAIDVVKDGDELVVRFWGFGGDEARGWFNSEPVRESLEGWHSIGGDFYMPFKLLKGEDLQ